MAEDNKYNRKYSFYVCGWCKTKIFYSKSSSPTRPCPECGWQHTNRYRYEGVPIEFKISLIRPSQT